MGEGCVVFPLGEPQAAHVEQTAARLLPYAPSSGTTATRPPPVCEPTAGWAPGRARTANPRTISAPCANVLSTNAQDLARGRWI